MKKERLKQSFKKIGMVTGIIMMACSQVVSAAPAVGETAKTWVLAQLMPVAIIVTIGLAVRELVRKNTVKLIFTIVIGGVVCAVIAKPEVIQNVGKWFLEILGVG